MLEADLECYSRHNDGSSANDSFLTDTMKALSWKRRVGPSGFMDQPALRVSESISSGKKILARSLIKSVKKNAVAKDLQKHLSAQVKRTKVVAAPSHRLESARVSRSVAYDQTVKDVSRFEGIVHRNRLIEQLVFPLNQVPHRLKTATAAAKQFQARCALEVSTSAILNSCKHGLCSDDILTKAEEELLTSMSLAEAKRRRAELQKMRSLMFYEEVKNRRQKQIKSKKFHRIAKMQRRKNLLKEFEDLAKRNPDEAKAKLELLECQRIQERMTLKHRHGGKWSKQMQLLSQKDPAVREALQSQLRLSRALTQKIDDGCGDGGVDASDDNVERMLVLAEAGAEELGAETDSSQQANPWLRINSTDNKVLRNSAAVRPTVVALTATELSKRQQSQADVGSLPAASDVFVSSEMRAVSPEGNAATSKLLDFGSATLDITGNGASEAVAAGTTSAKSRMSRKKASRGIATRKNVVDLNDFEMDALFDMLDTHEQIECFDVVSQNEKIADGTFLSPSQNPQKNSANSKHSRASVRSGKKMVLSRISQSSVDSSPSLKAKSKQTWLDANEMPKTGEANVDPHSYLKLPCKAISGCMDVANLELATTQMLVAEAFEDDDIVEQFNAEREAVEGLRSIASENDDLPGWGSWAGPGCLSNQSKKKQERNTRDDYKRGTFKPGVIMNEVVDNRTSKLQVNEIPFPFRSVDDFESSVCHPLGKEWNPETGYSLMIKPNVVTKLGTIIAPMDKEFVFKKLSRKHSIRLET